MKILKLLAIILIFVTQHSFAQDSRSLNTEESSKQTISVQNKDALAPKKPLTSDISEEEIQDRRKTLKYVSVVFFFLVIYRIHLFFKARKRKKYNKELRKERSL